MSNTKKWNLLRTVLLTLGILAGTLSAFGAVKFYKFSESIVYTAKLSYGFQSVIELEEGEGVENISLGNQFACQIEQLGNKLVIRPLEREINTNMLIVTNRRTYQFKLIASDAGSASEQHFDIIRFKYDS